MSWFPFFELDSTVTNVSFNYNTDPDFVSRGVKVKSRKRSYRTVERIIFPLTQPWSLWPYKIVYTDLVLLTVYVKRF